MEAFLNTTLSETDSPRRGRLDIGFFASLCSARLGDEMVAFARRCPEVELGIHEMTRASLLLALRAGEIAVAVMPEDHQAGINSTRLWQDRVLLAVHREHRLADLPRIIPDDLLDEVFLVQRDPNASTRHRFLIGRVLGREPSRSLLVDLNESGLMNAVAAGKGIALVCRSQVEPIDPSIVLRPIEATDAAFWISAYWRDEQPTGALAALLECFQNKDAREG